MVSINERLIFYEKLEKLLKSGNGLEKSLQLCQRSRPPKQLANVIRLLLITLKQHKTFEQALKNVKSIPPAEKSLLIAAFNTGRITPIMQKLIHYLQGLNSLKKSFLAAFLPNFFLLQLALLILPSISKISSTHNLTEVLAMQIPILLGVNAIALCFYLYSEIFINYISPFMLPIPFIGNIIKHQELFKFYLIYSQTLFAGLPFEQSFKLALAALAPTALRKELKKALIAVKHGKSPFPSLYHATHLPTEEINQWEIGHQTAEEVETLMTISQRNLEMAQQKLKLVAFIINKLILLLVFITIFIQTKKMMNHQFDLLDKIDQQ